MHGETNIKFKQLYNLYILIFTFLDNRPEDGGLLTKCRPAFPECNVNTKHTNGYHMVINLF